MARRKAAKRKAPEGTDLPPGQKRAKTGKDAGEPATLWEGGTQASNGKGSVEGMVDLNVDPTSYTSRGSGTEDTTTDAPATDTQASGDNTEYWRPQTTHSMTLRSRTTTATTLLTPVATANATFNALYPPLSPTHVATPRVTFPVRAYAGDEGYALNSWKGPGRRELEDTSGVSEYAWKVDRHWRLRMEGRLKNDPKPWNVRKVGWEDELETDEDEDVDSEREHGDGGEVECEDVGEAESVDWGPDSDEEEEEGEEDMEEHPIGDAKDQHSKDS